MLFSFNLKALGSHCSCACLYSKYTVKRQLVLSERDLDLPTDFILENYCHLSLYQ